MAKKRRTVTLRFVQKLNPCLNQQALLKMSDGKRRMNIFDVLRMNNATQPEKLWLVLRPEFLTESELRMLACDFVERALIVIDDSDLRVRAAISIARKYAIGSATDEVLLAAQAGAWSAEKDGLLAPDVLAARAAAQATQRTIHYTILDCAHFARRTVYSAASTVMDGAIAEIEDGKWQLERVIAVLTGGE